MAAQIQADAAIKAAYIQGAFSFGGSVFVILAALVAYAASRRQVWLVEKHASRHANAFADRVRAKTNGIIKLCEVIAIQIKVLSFSPESDIHFDAPLLEAEIFSEKYWEEHAMLGPTAVVEISVLCQQLEFLNAAIAEAKSEQTDLSSPSKLPRADSVVRSPGGNHLVRRMTVFELLKDEIDQTISISRPILRVCDLKHR